MNKLFEYYPMHFRSWADSIKHEYGYEAAICIFFRELADALESGKIPIQKEETDG